MKTQACTKSWRRYLTSSTLILTIIIILMIFKTIFAIQRESEDLSNFINKEIVVQFNDEIIVNKQLTTDTLNIYVNSYRTSVEQDSIDLIDTTKTVDTIILDTLKNQQ